MASHYHLKLNRSDDITDCVVCPSPKPPFVISKLNLLIWEKLYTEFQFLYSKFQLNIPIGFNYTEKTVQL